MGPRQTPRPADAACCTHYGTGNPYGPTPRYLYAGARRGGGRGISGEGGRGRQWRASEGRRENDLTPQRRPHPPTFRSYNVNSVHSTIPRLSARAPLLPSDPDPLPSLKPPLAPSPPTPSSPLTWEVADPLELMQLGQLGGPQGTPAHIPLAPLGGPQASFAERKLDGGVGDAAELDEYLRSQDCDGVRKSSVLCACDCECGASLHLKASLSTLRC